MSLHKCRRFATETSLGREEEASLLPGRPTPVVSDGYRGICTRTKLPRDAEFLMTRHSNPKYAFLTFGSDSSAVAMSEKRMRPVSIT
jgi:hypothetical protein